MRDAGAEGLFQRMNRFYAAYVGQTNALTPAALLSLCAQAGLTDCAGDAADMEPIYAEQPAPEYSSRVFAGDTPPISMRFFPQRFGYGAWVTSQTTTPVNNRDPARSTPFCIIWDEKRPGNRPAANLISRLTGKSIQKKVIRMNKNGSFFLPVCFLSDKSALFRPSRNPLIIAANRKTSGMI